jgi:hypothetical protein
MKKILLLAILMMLSSCGTATQTPTSSRSSGEVVSPAVDGLPASGATVSPTASANGTATSASNLPGIPVGWRWLVGTRIKVAVPANYVGGSPENVGAIAAQLPEAGLDEAALAELLGRYIGPTNLFAIDRTTLSKAFPTNLSIALDGKPAAKNLDGYLAAAVKELATDWQIQKQEKVTLGTRQFAKIRATAKKSPVSAIFYITADANKFWLLTFTVENGAIDAQQATFQKIAESLQ